MAPSEYLKLDKAQWKRKKKVRFYFITQILFLFSSHYQRALLVTAASSDTDDVQLFDLDECHTGAYSTVIC